MRAALAVAFAIAATSAFAQSMIAPPPQPGVEVPDWALPQSPTHKQVAPPPGFHRPSQTFSDSIGAFDAQTDVGGPLIPGSAVYNASTGRYTISSAGYNIWYNRDEFRFLWKKMSGDVSLAASVEWPNLDEFHDRKVALVIRESLDDDSREVVAAQHGNGMVHIAWRAETNGMMTDISHRMARQPDKSKGESGPQAIHASRIGIEKKGDQFQLWVSWQGEPIHPEGAPITFKTSGPLYVGIGFTSHLAGNLLTAKVADVEIDNAAGRIK